jgi:ssDNA-binding Zn-finger/Zn-ribbon topoisomerase 1
VHLCPKCGESMSIRKALRGKNAGNIFWVCTQFPGCRGVIRA